MTDLIDILSFSNLLAHRWAQVTPDMELAWNPRDGESATFAAHKWLAYVSNNLFPVSAGEYEEVLDLQETLEHIFPETMGFDIDDVDPKELEGADKILCLFHIAHNGYGEEAIIAIEELCILGFIISEDVTLTGLESMRTALDDWLAGGCLPETEYDYWEGCVALIRYYLNDTGADYLNLSYIQLYSGGYEMLRWTPENIETLRADWAVARALLEKMKAFRAWYKENERYALSVLLDLNEDIAARGDEEE